jgi:hypothetical protein
MQTNDSAEEKRTAVEYLSFGKKTAKRVSWESWEFTIVDPYLVQVTNASYGYLKDDHSYTVGVEVRDGVAVPAECECPADMYHEEYDCKHKVSLAAIGGPTVLNAAVAFSPHTTPSKEAESETIADRLKPDGGSLKADTEPETCPNGNDRCDGPDSDGLPCWPCYRDGFEEPNPNVGEEE